MIYYYEWFWRQEYQHHLSFDTMHSFDSGGGSNGSWVWLKGVMCSPTRLPLAFIFSLRGKFWRIFFFILRFDTFFHFVVLCAFSLVISNQIAQLWFLWYYSRTWWKYFWVKEILFTNVKLFTIYEVNWQIGHGKWLIIAMFFTI